MKRCVGLSLIKYLANREARFGRSDRLVEPVKISVIIPFRSLFAFESERMIKKMKPVIESWKDSREWERGVKRAINTRERS